jgi:16S rRNA (cytosine967-C5)-methyltransferase
MAILRTPSPSNDAMFAARMASSGHIHRNLIEAVEIALQKIFSEGRYADQVIEQLLKQNPKWGSRDRRFIAETSYDIVRWWRKILYCGSIAEDDELLFRKAVYTWLLLQRKSLPFWMNLKMDEASVLRRAAGAERIRALHESVPDWLDQLGEAELGIHWNKEIHALNEQAQVILRTNTLRCSRGELQEELKSAAISTEEIDGLPDALLLSRRMNVFKLDSFKQGKFEVQDASSQQVAPFVDVAPGMRVIDACAGAGGKTLHLAALMKNTGHIIATDTEQWKLDELRRRARRAGASNIEARLIDSSKVIKRLHGSADRVLLDVPCSGLGVLRRNPDAKWKLSEVDLHRVRKTQEEILERYSLLAKPRGKLVYATCSILPSENQNQVRSFLQHHNNFDLEEEKQILPSEGFDGFYMARMIRSQ